LIENGGSADPQPADQPYVILYRPDPNLASYGQPEALEAARASWLGLSIRCGSESAVVDLQTVASRDSAIGHRVREESGLV
jgi:hypothetical protein